MTKYENAQQKVTESSKKANTALSSLVKGFNSLGAVLGVSFGLYGVFRGFKEIISTITDFNLAQKKLQSILGETEQGMKGVAQSAIDIGRASIFGAKGVTELQVELAKMGFAKDEIISMQEAIVNLATATQEELAPSAEVVANIIRAFQLPATEAARVVDVMGKAFNDSALDLSNFREAIKYVAPVAKQAGFTLEQTVAALEHLSQVGIKGSLAGTGLNNVLKAMMDGNSKLSKAIGGTVEGYDGFISVLKKARDEGWNSEKIFGLITQRATAAFTTFKDGVDNIEKFKTSLENASGVMAKQAAVQLESISFKAKLAKESFKAMILEMDSGSGLLSTAIKNILDLFTSLTSKSKTLGDTFFDQRKSVGDLVTSISPLIERYATLTNNYDPLFDKTKLTKEQQEELGIIITKVAEAIPGAVTAFDEYGKALDINGLKAEEFIQTQISIMKIINKSAIVEAENILLEIGGKLNSARKVYDLILKTGEITTTSGQSVNVRKATQQEIADAQAKFAALSQEYKDYQAYIDSLNGDALQKELDFRKNMKSISDNPNLTPKAEFDPEAAKKALQERIKNEIEILELQKKLSAEKIKLNENGNTQIVSLGLNSLKFDKLLNDKKLELAIAFDEDKTKSHEKYIIEGQILEAQYYNVLAGVWDDAVKANDKAWEEMNKNRDSRFKDAAKQRETDTKDLFDWIEDQKKKMFELEKFKTDNPIAALLGITNDTELDAAKEGFDFMKDQVSGLADAWVTSMDKIVEARNNMVDEAEQALQTEIQLAELGYANNVTLKQKELADAKKLRQQAIDEQYKAQKIQLAIDTATQSQSLITAAAQLIKSGTKFGVPGLLLSFGAISLMFATFKKYQLLAQQNAAQKYETGGWVGGKRHSQGGTHIEAETGEYVINRKSAAKHKLMIEAINNDDNVTLNKMYINGLKNGVLNARVSLDDSEDLKAIRKALEKQGKQVSYFGNYRIEKEGNVTTKIMMN